MSAGAYSVERGSEAAGNAVCSMGIQTRRSVLEPADATGGASEGMCDVNVRESILV